MEIRRLLAASAALALLGAPAAAQPAPAGAGPTVYAFGGTPVSNGVFFPGTAFYNSETRQFDTVGPPLQVEKGQNVSFVNLDVAAVANAHRIRSIKVRKDGRPLFQSAEVAGPGSAVVRTKHLKPGTYYYLCTTHAGMFGVLEVASPP